MARVSFDGAFSQHRVAVICCRWGGGADFGKTHVYIPGTFHHFGVSLQCVVDDFGNLVRV